MRARTLPLALLLALLLLQTQTAQAQTAQMQQGSSIYDLPERIFDIRDYGAEPASFSWFPLWQRDNAAAIQAAVDAAHAAALATHGELTLEPRGEALQNHRHHGEFYVGHPVPGYYREGGVSRFVVLVPGPEAGGGTFYTSTVFLKSYVTLRVAEGATLKGVAENAAYPELAPAYPSILPKDKTQALLHAEGQRFLAVEGPGTIDGNGPVLGFRTNKKPLGLWFASCQYVTVRSIRLVYAASWMQLYQDCDNVRIGQVTVYNHGNGQCDGLDIDSSRGVWVQDVDIDAYDDALAVKTSGPKPSWGISIAGAVLRSMKRLIKVGTESVADIGISGCEGITGTICRRTWLNLLPKPPEAGIFIAMVDGGSLRGSFRRIDLGEVGTPLYLVTGELGRSPAGSTAPRGPGSIDHLDFRAIQATCAADRPMLVSGLPGAPLRELELSHWKVTLAGESYTDGETAAYAPGEKPAVGYVGERLIPRALLARHVENLELRFFCLQQSEDATRPPFLFEDVTPKALGIPGHTAPPLDPPLPCPVPVLGGEGKPTENIFEGAGCFNCLEPPPMAVP